ncbi:DivIVA domain-containing protein [Solwaraspora sp. WMMD791]|uniref:DivIVA domain-containing protein n=1 Tax=Solwaraspora sp. WMMD791 TaxID=3016086 RepID=UPI00249C28B0|nr:DivIVA domain-containing protein [Solwaraspora sp. WMMD791]WFE27340.1 DivIVA domain-containing protein [Solwaraspora sp. WMMD791]
MASQGQRFRRKALRRGYKVDEVDAFLDRVEATLAGEPVGSPVSAQEVHDVVFRVRFNGYDEWQVDLHLDRVERQLAELEERGPAARGSGAAAVPPERLAPPPREDRPIAAAAPALPARPVPAQPAPPPHDPYGGGGYPEQPAAAGYGRYDDPRGAGGYPPPGGGPGGPPATPVPAGPHRGFGPGPEGRFDGFEQGRHGKADMTAEIYFPDRRSGPAGPPTGGHPQLPGGMPGPGGPGPRDGGFGPRDGGPGMPGPGGPGFGGHPGPGGHSGAAGHHATGGYPGVGGYPGGPGQPGLGTPPGGPPAGGGGDLQRVDQIRRTFQVRRFGSGYDPMQVDRLFEDILTAMAGRGPMPVNTADLDTMQFGLVTGGYFEAEVDAALKEVQDILHRGR